MESCKTKTSLLLVVSCLLLGHLPISTAQGIAACCTNNTSAACQLKCRELDATAATRNLQLTEQQDLLTVCPRHYINFWSCVNSIHCCDRASTELCRSRCIETVSIGGNETVNTLVLTCGRVDLSDPFWICLLSSPPTFPPTPPKQQNADWARLQCCYKVKNKKCKKNCVDVQMKKAKQEQFDNFHDVCLHLPEENSLITCISDVEKGPCKLGCSGMQFCSNFNNRPYQAFRRCDVEMDRKAKQEYLSLVQDKPTSQPLIATGVTVTSIENCLPDMWKAVVCMVFLEPCESSTHSTQLCRKDCLKLLESCGNSTTSPSTICDIVAPDSVNSNCIPLDQFLHPSSFGDDAIAPKQTMINNPCDPNPCMSGFYCVINRLCDAAVDRCTPYKCHPGCVVGNLPGIPFIKGSAVRVSLFSNSSSRCFGYFNCTSPIRIETDNSNKIFDQKVHPPILNFIPTNCTCEREKSCTLPNGETRGHQSHFWMNCNFCYCNYGRIICTKRICENNSALFGQECNCTNNYSPVCTNSGITIRNKCTAICLGYTTYDFHPGYCGSLYQCSRYHSNQCRQGSTCIPLRHTCLASNFSRQFCQQYTCESSHDTCARTATPTPVCDVFNNQHTSLCALLGTQDHFSYWGYCKEECKKDDTSSVCGANGETFPSRCHAQTMHISVDYLGDCVAAPQIGTDDNEDPLVSLCENVTCPDLDFAGCRTVIPYGACCPICGSSIIILNDNEVLEDNLVYLNQDYISSNDVIERLQHHINYIQCHVYGHILEDGSLLLILVPEKSYDNRDVLSEVCYHEIVKLCTLINNQSPLITDDVFLSHLVAAYVENGTEASQPSTDRFHSTTIINDSTKLAVSLFSLFSCIYLTVALF